ncbi:MAG: DUF2214 domain-containing protein [Beijerinckiaceae bacterium]|nr:DUF2214 domain-containing protein [Beijerinckiaceae bacterium]
METLAGWLGALPGSGVLRASPTAYLLINAAHILGIALLVGAILPLDLSLAGVLRGPALDALAPFASRVAAGGLALAAATGLYLLSVRPSDYLANPAFLTKLGLLALALINIAMQHMGPGWRRVLAGERPSPAVRAVALTSAGLWVSVLVAGRWIGFV